MLFYGGVSRGYKETLLASNNLEGLNRRCPLCYWLCRGFVHLTVISSLDDDSTVCFSNEYRTKIHGTTSEIDYFVEYFFREGMRGGVKRGKNWRNGLQRRGRRWRGARKTARESAPRLYDLFRGRCGDSNHWAFIGRIPAKSPEISVLFVRAGLSGFFVHFT